VPPAEDRRTKTSSSGGAAVNLPLVEAAATRLPESYEPLLLTFYRAPLEVVEGAVVIGTDDGAEFRVDLDSGRVSAVDREGDQPPRFVNSSMDQLAEAIAAYRDYAARVCGVDDDEATRLVQELRRRLEAMDAAAISDPGMVIADSRTGRGRSAVKNSAHKKGTHCRCCAPSAGCGSRRRTVDSGAAH
jgi:hypothetical protein